MIFVTGTREATAIARLAEDLTAHGGDPQAVRAGSIDMSGSSALVAVNARLPSAPDWKEQETWPPVESNGSLWRGEATMNEDTALEVP